jgi:hypothetical protein
MLYRSFHEVLTALLPLHKAVVQQSKEDEAVSMCIAGDPKYAPYFADCVVALDGTHVDVYVSGEPSVPFRNRKGTLSQNVLIVCDFEMMFRFILSSWEGSAYDVRVLRDAASQGGFMPPKGKFYLGDAGYSNGEWLLTLYRGVKYYIREQ